MVIPAKEVTHTMVLEVLGGAVVEPGVKLMNHEAVFFDGIESDVVRELNGKPEHDDTNTPPEHRVWVRHQLVLGSGGSITRLHRLGGCAAGRPLHRGSRLGLLAHLRAR